MNMTTQSGRKVYPIGQGTWFLGEKQNRFAQECDTLRAGVEAGMNLIDTAEMYGEGLAEKLVGTAIQGMEREDLFLVSKVYPFHADRKHIFRSCENTLRRMQTDYLDLYLLHWRGSVPFQETVMCMEELKEKGFIRHWGASNLDTEDMRQLLAVEDGKNCAANQVLYHLGSRGIEFDLLPLLQKLDIPVMAYCPLAQAGSLRRGLLTHPAVRQIAEAHTMTASQVLLAFLLAAPGVLPIPRTSRPEHAIENAAAASLRLSEEEMAMLNQAFPSPSRKMPLDIV